MKVAALDLGSNTFLCLICEVENKKITKVYSDEVEIVRLGQDLLKNKKFQPDALARAKNCLLKFKSTIEQYKPERVLAMATSAARDAENKEALFEICQQLNIPLEIIAGDKEAEITYRGSISKQTTPSLKLVIDIGGGSTEFIFGQKNKMIYAESFNIGCVRLTEQHISCQPTTDQDIQRSRLVIQSALARLPDYGPLEILAVAGTPTTLAAVEIGEFNVEKIDGYVMTLDRLEEWLAKLQPLSIEEKIDLGFPRGRADIILIGLITLIETLKKFNLNKLIISTRGVRYGVALELADRN